jgi:hypothetical protein
MKYIIPVLRSPLIISTLLVLPFIALELVNRQKFHEGFPIPLFGSLWLLGAAFIFILMPVLRNTPLRDKSIINPLSLFLRAALLIVIAWLWVGIVLDQMPCFLGVPYCD